MELHTKTNLWRAESWDVSYARATPRWSPLQLPLVLHNRLVFGLAGLFLSATQPIFSRSPSNNFDCLRQPISGAEINQPMAYRRPRGNGRQHTVHGVFEKVPAIPPELFLQVEHPDFLKGYQHSGSVKKMLIVNGSTPGFIGSHVLLPFLY